MKTNLEKLRQGHIHNQTHRYLERVRKTGLGGGRNSRATFLSRGAGRVLPKEVPRIPLPGSCRPGAGPG